MNMTAQALDDIRCAILAATATPHVRSVSELPCARLVAQEINIDALLAEMEQRLAEVTLDTLRCLDASLLPLLAPVTVLSA